ncbi:hypothetical protein PLESTB_000893900 [Pleodorina starrii]|uniref:Uncharacterized protein n=1 Tax=Pleodorina starrii TaxID=330485 RepID=A0A9W6BLW2_9CHLO|nr:hypothetical protein PLESTB_000893900 [Pleodorina starrii]
MGSTGTGRGAVVRSIGQRSSPESPALRYDAADLRPACASDALLVSELQSSPANPRDDQGFSCPGLASLPPAIAAPGGSEGGAPSLQHLQHELALLRTLQEQLRTHGQSSRTTSSWPEVSLEHSTWTSWQQEKLQLETLLQIKTEESALLEQMVQVLSEGAEVGSGTAAGQPPGQQRPTDGYY